MPPYCAALKTNIGEQFLRLLDKHFPVNNPLHKLFNRKTVKLNYSCAQNFKTIIQNHNRKVMASSKSTEEPQKLCNCRKPKECPLQGKCLEDNIIYKAVVNTPQKAEYVGCTTTSFKLRYGNHKKSFTHEEHQHNTTLSSYVWEKNLNPTPDIQWSILKKCGKYQPGQRACQICTEEKFFIIKGLQKVRNINKKTDIGTKCNHRRKATLKFMKF